MTDADIMFAKLDEIIHLLKELLSYEEARFRER